MESDFLAFCTDGKIYVTSSRDAALAAANVNKVLEIAPQGQQAVLIATYSGTGSPYTITLPAAVPNASQTIRKHK